jgi:hypothetical protein
MTNATKTTIMINGLDHSWRRVWPGEKFTEIEYIGR